MMEKEEKGIKKYKKVMKYIIGISLGVLGGYLLPRLLVALILLIIAKTSDTDQVYELTEAELEYLISEYPEDEERMREGRLWGSRVRKWEDMRYALAYLEEKYPGYIFHLDDILLETAFDICYFNEEISGWNIKVNVRKDEEGNYCAEDNFYGYFIEEEYEAYLEERLKEKVEEIVKINSHMDYMRGIEYDCKITVEDMIVGKLDINPDVIIHIAGKNMQEERCNECIEEIKMELENMDIRGIYDITFWDMTRENMLGLPAKEYGEYFKSVLIKKEDNKWKIIY